MAPKIQIGQNAKTTIEWRVKTTDYSEEKKNAIISLWAKKYGVPESSIRVEPVYINDSGKEEVLNNENIKNIQDPIFQQELFAKYLKANDITDCDFDEIVKIDSQINSLIDYNSYEKSKRYDIKWVKWSNFLSYGENNFFDFTTLKGLVLLNGQPANESGKSTFAYDLLHYLLFGKTQTDKATNQGQLFNNYIPEATTMTVEGCINIDNEDYIIKRVLSRPALTKKTKNRTVSAKVEYYRLMSDGSREELADGDNLQEESSRKTSMAIKEALGNEADFDRIISANSKDLDSLISMKETERGRLLSKWIGLSVLEDKDALAREKWNKEISKKRYCDIYNTVSLQTEIENLNESNKESENAIKANEQKVKDCEERIAGHEKTRNTLISSRQTVDENLAKIDIHTQEQKISNITEKGLETKAQIDATTQKIAEIGDISYSDDEYQSARSESEGYVSRIATIKAEIRNLQATNKTLSSAEYCPTCGRKFDNVDNSGKINENNIKIENLKNEGIEINGRKQSLDLKIATMDENRKKVNEKHRLEATLASLNVNISELRNNLREAKEVKVNYEKNKEAIAKNNEIDNTLNLLSENIKTEERIKNQAVYDIATYRKSIESNNNAITEKKAMIVRIEEERKTEKNWKTYLQMIGKDGISKMVMRDSIPIINRELDRLLGDVADFSVEISINEKNDIEFWLIRDGVKTRLAAASGLERTQASLALRVVLGQMSKLSRPPFLLLDEILGTVAKDSYDNMKKLYDKIVSNYSFVLHITHLADIQDWHDKIITVQKVNNISSIVA